MSRIKFTAALAGCFVALALAAPASAGNPFGGGFHGSHGGKFGGGFHGRRGFSGIGVIDSDDDNDAYTDLYAPLYQNYIDDLPYYSLFPPVYYSAPIPRTYGYSPFAYPPYVRTPDLEMTGPQDIMNPHVPPSDETEGPEIKPTSERTASKVQVIVNPYVVSEGPVLAGAR